MPKVLRTVLLTILLTAGALLSGADLLDTLGEQLDKLEPRFWPALAVLPTPITTSRPRNCCAKQWGPAGISSAN